jgi:hypothetical protein
MRAALDAIAALLTNGGCTDALKFDWSGLDHQQTAAVRAVSKEALHRVQDEPISGSSARNTQECLALSYISLEAYQRAVDLEPFQRLIPADVEVAFAQGPMPTPRPGPASDAAAHKSRMAVVSYLGRLNPSTRRNAGLLLGRVAELLTSGRCSDGLQFDWATIEREQTDALRAAFINARYTRGTINNYMGVLRVVVSECRCLGYLTGEEVS